MIGLIVGEVTEDGVVLTPGGVGYIVETITPLEVGTQVRLHTHAVYREDDASLYGFESKEERTLFADLLNTPGVGPKMAISMIRTLGVGGVKRVFRDRDEAAVADLVKVDGVGKRTAEKLLLLVKIDTDGAEESPKSRIEGAVTHMLGRLGFSEAEIAEALQHVTETDDPSVAANQAIAAVRANKEKKAS